MRAHESGYLARPAPSGLADVVETILDKGIVIDAYARVSLLGIELLTLDARIVVASVDTYLRFAEATSRLDLTEKGAKSPAELLTEGAETLTERVASSVVEHKVGGVVDTAADAVDAVEDVADKIADKAGDVMDRFRSDE
jgi:gas vesicle structural protein